VRIPDPVAGPIGTLDPVAPVVNLLRTVAAWDGQRMRRRALGPSALPIRPPGHGKLIGRVQIVQGRIGPMNSGEGFGLRSKTNPNGDARPPCPQPRRPRPRRPWPAAAS